MISSFCNGSNGCVDVEMFKGAVLVRDTKNPHASPLRFTREEWEAFLAGVTAGEFNFPVPGQLVRALDRRKAEEEDPSRVPSGARFNSVI